MAIVNYSKDDFGQLIRDTLDETLKKRINREFDDYKDELIKRLELERDLVLAQSVIRIMSFVRVEDHGRELRITVSKENPHA